MTTRRTATLLLLLAASPLHLSLLAQQGDRGGRRQRPEPASVTLTNFTFQEARFDSKAVGREMPYGIYLPKGYDDEANKNVKWPLVLWLHGMFEDHLRFHTRGGAPVLDQCVTDGKLPPCVFVTANGGSTSMYVNRKDQRWEDLITVDLLDHLTKTYRVSESRDERAILGVSMGGMAALRIAFTKPDLFGVVGAHSAAVFPEDPADLPERMQAMASRPSASRATPTGSGSTRCSAIRSRRSPGSRPTRSASHSKPLPRTWRGCASTSTPGPRTAMASPPATSCSTRPSPSTRSSTRGV